MNEFFLLTKKQEIKEKETKTLLKDEKSKSFSDFSKILRDYTFPDNLNKSQIYLNPDTSNNLAKKNNLYEKIYLTSWGFSKYGQLGALLPNNKSTSPILLELSFKSLFFSDKTK